MIRTLSPQSFARLLAITTLGLCSCATPRDRAAEIVGAATAGHMKPVVACWEKEHETSGFQGEYIAVVDFEIGGNEHFRNASVKSLEPVDNGAPSRDLTEFRSCIEKALDEVELPTETDAGGPGYSAVFGVSVHNYRIAFVGDQAGRREEADGRQAHVLIGPRADRCQGLYTYNPPRDSSTLFTEIALMTSKPANPQDKDAVARELQRMYDLQLELAARLEADLANSSLPAVNRKRLVDALEAAKRETSATAERIGCGAVRPEK